MSARMVRTVEELRALDSGVVILDRDGMALQRDGSDWSGGGRWWDSGQITLPATVLAPATDPDDPELIERVAEAIAGEYDLRGHLKPGAYWGGEHRRVHLRNEAHAALKALAVAQ